MPLEGKGNATSFVTLDTPFLVCVLKPRIRMTKKNAALRGTATTRVCASSAVVIVCSSMRPYDDDRGTMPAKCVINMTLALLLLTARHTTAQPLDPDPPASATDD